MPNAPAPTRAPAGAPSASSFPAPTFTSIGPGHMPVIDHPTPNSSPPTTVPRLSALRSRLVQYDSQDGGAHGGLVGIGAGHFIGGFESMRTWNDWQAHTSPIVLGGIEIPGASRQFGKKMNVASRDVGGLAQSENGSVSLGFYSGVTFGSGRTFGGGAYGTLRWNACR